MPALKNRHRFAVLTAFICALALAGCGQKDDPPKAQGDPKPVPGPTPPATVDLTKEKPEATYTMQAFLEEMIKDRNFPVSKHAGKVIDLTGVVTGYGAGPNVGALMIETDPKRPQDARACEVTSSQPWTKVLPTQTVTLRTRVASSTSVPSSQWQFIEAKGPPPATFTAEQFVKEWKAHSEAFKKKYSQVSVIVTGTVAEVKVTDGGGAEILLTADDKARLLCTFPHPGFAAAPLTESQKAALKPGLKVKLLGEFSGGDRLAFCIMLEPAP